MKLQQVRAIVARSSRRVSLLGKWVVAPLSARYCCEVVERGYVSLGQAEWISVKGVLLCMDISCGAGAFCESSEGPDEGTHTGRARKFRGKRQAHAQLLPAKQVRKRRERFSGRMD